MQLKLLSQPYAIMKAFMPNNATTPDLEVGSILYKGESGLHVPKERLAEVDDKRVISPLNRGFRHAPCRFGE